MLTHTENSVKLIFNLREFGCTLAPRHISCLDEGVQPVQLYRTYFFDIFSIFSCFYASSISSKVSFLIGIADAFPFVLKD